MTAESDNWIVVGQLGAPYGIKGWVKLRSFTQPADNICGYGPWRLRLADDALDRELVRIKRHGKAFIAEVSDVGDRDGAAAVSGAEVLVSRSCFAPATKDEFYWSDLLQMRVATTDGSLLGQVAEIMETGANDVLVVEGDRRRLVPFVMHDVVRSVDQDAGLITVDWDPDF